MPTFRGMRRILSAAEGQGLPVGRVTSGGYGYTVDKSLALAFLQPDHAVPGTAVSVMLLGLPHGATVLAAPPFDPKGVRLRA